MNYSNMLSDGRDVQPAPTGAPAMSATPLPLVRESSIYSLTFDEFQNTMGSFGKDFGSMNMDEFLKNIWTAEESQAMASALGGGGITAGGIGLGPGLQRQGSLTLPRTISQKTVDEVWRDLAVVQGAGGSDFQQQQQQQQRQPTLGEMTLEEFLVRAGVVREDINQSALQPMVNNGNIDCTNNGNSVFYGELSSSNNHPGLALGFPQPGRSDGTIVPNPVHNNSPANLAMAATSARPYISPLPLGNAADLASPQRMRGGGVMRIGDPAMGNELMSGVVGMGGARIMVPTVGSPANQISTDGFADGFAKGNGDLSSLSPVPYVFSGGLKGRKSSGTVEKVVERRQRRMIKNRESAARSRARKQAYTMELEAEVAKLKEQNQELQKKQAEIMEMQKSQVLERINQQRGPKKRCLRRTQTGPW